jgi:hypothetical protein
MRNSSFHANYFSGRIFITFPVKTMNRTNINGFLNLAFLSPRRVYNLNPPQGFVKVKDLRAYFATGPTAYTVIHRDARHFTHN